MWKWLKNLFGGSKKNEEQPMEDVSSIPQQNRESTPESQESVENDASDSMEEGD